MVKFTASYRGLDGRALVALTIGAALLAGCSSRQTIDPESAGSVAVADVLPSPELSDMYAVERDVRFGPGDTLAVSVLGAPDLSSDYIVDGSGFIDFPLVGGIEVVGRTSREVASSLEDSLGARYLRNPQVTVNSKSLVSQQVTILGGVTQPGRYSINGRTTLRDALAQARGVSELGAEKDIVVFRTVGGQRLAARFDLREINAGRLDDPLLFPTDRVFVATSRNRQLLRDLAPLVPLTGIFYQIF